MEKIFPKFSKVLSCFLTFLLLFQFFYFVATKPQEAKADAASWYNSSWIYRKKITIDHTKVSATLTNFPVLVNLSSDSNLASKAQSDGDDILFTSSDGTTKLSHEIEKYSSSTGQLVAYVKIPSLASTTDTEIYMYYGNALASSQEEATSTWDSNFKMVHHMEDTEDSVGLNNISADETLKAFSGYGLHSSQALTGIATDETFGCLLRDKDLNLVLDGTTARMYTIVATADEDTDVRDFDIASYNVGSATKVMDADISTWASVHMVLKIADDFYLMLYTSEDVGGGRGVRAATSSSYNGTFTQIPKTQFKVTPAGGWEGTVIEQDVGARKISEDSQYIYYWLLYSDQSDSNHQTGWYKARVDKINKTVEYVERYSGNPLTALDNNDYPYNRVGGTNPITTIDGKYLIFYLSKPNGGEYRLSYALSEDEMFSSISEKGIIGPPLGLGTHIDELYMEKFDSYLYDGYLTVLSESRFTNNDYGVVARKYELGHEISGIAGPAKQVEGNGYMTLGTNATAPDLNGASGITLSAWINPNSLEDGVATDRNNIIDLLIDGSGGASLTLTLRYGGNIWLGGRSKASDSFQSVETTDTASTGSWQNITGVLDIANDKIYLYYNGSLASSSSVSFGNSTFTNGTPTSPDRIGASASAATSYTFDGLMDEIRLSSTVRSSHWIATEYNNLNSPSTFYSLGSEDGYPIAPTIGTPTVLSSSAIRWNFTDNNSYETGFRVYTNADAIATSSATANLTYLNETGLSENTQYIRYVKAYNSYGESASSSATSTYTLADTPTGFNFMRHPSSLDIYVDSFPNSNSGSSGYLFWRTDNSAYNSGWIQTNNWQDPNMVEGQTYTYGVKYRNGNGVETATTTMGGVSFVHSSGGGGTPTIPQQTTSTSSVQATTTSATSTQINTTTTQQTSTSAIPNLAGLTGQARQVAIQQIRDMITQIQKQLIILIGQLIQALQLQLGSL